MTLRCRAVTFVVSGLLVGPLASTTKAERLPLQNFTVRDGLPSDTINCIVRDRAGFIWICTTEGLAVYDGFVFRTFGPADGLPHRNVTTVLPARDGSYWIGTDDGLVRFRPTARAAGKSRFTVVRPPAPTNWAPDKVIANRVMSLLEDRSGRIWCGTAQAGLFIVEANGDDLGLIIVGPELPIDTQITALAEAPDGAMWIGTQRGLLRRTPTGAGEWFGYREGLTIAPGVVNEEIGSLLVLGSDLFVGTRLAGLHQVDINARPGGRAVERSWRSPNAQGGDGVSSLIATSTGHLWYGGPGGARQVVLDADPRGGPRVWGVGDGLGPGDVLAVAEDAGGNIWIGTDGAGVFRLRRGGFTTFTVDDGLAGNQVKDLFMAGGNLHVVTANARGLFLNRFEGGRFKSAAEPYLVEQLAWGTNQIAMSDRVGDWWFATWTGAIRSAARSLEGLAGAPVRRYGTRQGVWSDSVANVIGRASSFGADLFQLRGTEWRCSVADDAAGRRLAPDVKRHLLLLIKEALNNIAKHAGAGEASLKVDVGEGDLIVQVSDDGRGFGRDAIQQAGTQVNGGGHGLANIEERARLMGGRVEVRSAPGQGCSIELRIPGALPSRSWRRLLGTLRWRR